MKKLALAAIAAAIVVPTAAPAPVFAQDHHYDRDRDYRGQDRYYREHCKKSSGTTGLIAGGAGGALAGHALGGGTLGTVAGGVGGALLGKHLDKKHDSAQNRRNGC
jgi:isoaspartyl peptidase/L-asparaginase-like protein (Ntn-hydrolase superfamily)